MKKIFLYVNILHRFKYVIKGTMRYVEEKQKIADRVSKTNREWPVQIKLWKCIVNVLGVICLLVGLTHQEVDLMGFYIGTVMQIVCGIGCGAMSYINAFSPENNKLNFIGMGFCGMGLLKVIYVYIFSTQRVTHDMMLQYMIGQNIINIMEMIVIYIGIYVIHDESNMKKYCAIGELVIIALLLILFKRSYWIKNIVNYIELDTMQLYINILSLLGWSLIILHNYLFRDRFNTITNHYIRNIGIVQCLYSITQLITFNLSDLFIEHGYYIRCLFIVLKCHVYIWVFKFIHDYTIYIVWKDRDRQVLENRQKLADDEGEKYLFGMSSRILEKEVNATYDLALKMHDDIKNSKYSYELKYVDKIINNCRRLMKLNANIRDLNDMEIGKQNISFEVINIVKFVESLIESTVPYIEAMCMKIKVIKKAESIYCSVNVEAMERVILNLLSNAIKYGGNGGNIEVYINLKKDKVYICIRDYGVGIPEDKLKTAFNQFERLDNTLSRSKEGSGLGLAIVRSIVQMHQGTINIVSAENEGTRVSISLPVCKQGNSKVEFYQGDRYERLENKIQVEFSDLNV